MSNISIKINLQQFKHVHKSMKKKDGTSVDCLVIPIDSNNFYKGDKGTYLDMTAIALKEPRPDSKDTHLVKQNLPKEVYNSLTEEEKHAIPILGNAKLWNGHGEPEPNTDTSIDEDQDDLPF